MLFSKSMLARCALALVVGAALFAAPAPSVCASDTKILLEDRYGSPRFKKIKVFGNRRRIAKLIDASYAPPNTAIYQKELACRPQNVLMPIVGNEGRIATYVDPFARDTSESVVVVKNPEGRRNMVRIRFFGNRNRIQKWTGQDIE